ncbi:hypothetical protein NW768_002771 [Fusarium equiseti]|uniref:Prion-inhibition and propagation HeLo domain-containing protein n=1 Tax=Fusarium equiseti TaxID=61235 RepID=A0ABQ8RK46_FUSEQ|nr:hypothetical protein NW768_002771 [Fusarium equiseti]
MAEPFGVVAGALGIVGLFNNCVESFQYIRLGRRFEQDYKGSRLRLDVAQMRLNRWGEAVQIHQNSSFIDNHADEQVELARSILEQIANLFTSAWKKSQQYESVTDQHDLMLLDDNDMGPTDQDLHRKLNDKFRKRYAKVTKKTFWALYDGRNLERLVGQIATFVEELEELFPIEAASRQLAKDEIKEIEDEASLKRLQAAADGIDTDLKEAAKRKTNTIASRNSVKAVDVDGYAMTQVGNHFGEVFFAQGRTFCDSTTNTVETVTARGGSRTQVGNSFGGGGVTDN